MHSYQVDQRSGPSVSFAGRNLEHSRFHLEIVCCPWYCKTLAFSHLGSKRVSGMERASLLGQGTPKANQQNKPHLWINRCTPYMNTACGIRKAQRFQHSRKAVFSPFCLSGSATKQPTEHDAARCGNPSAPLRIGYVLVSGERLLNWSRGTPVAGPA
jgi:hypothetical protein